MAANTKSEMIGMIRTEVNYYNQRFPEEMLPKSLKDAWVAALRSGAYQQGQQYLKCDGKYCCLGVLAEILEIDLNQYSPTVLKTYALSPLKDNNVPQILNSAVPKALARLNDSSVPFSEIADIIEEHL
jgi:hypothetical protein